MERALPNGCEREREREREKEREPFAKRDKVKN